jgi:hypothetical protein
LLFLGITLFGCHTEVIKEPRPIDVVLGKIGGTWRVTEVILGGVKKPDYEKGSVAFMESQEGDLIYFLTDGMPVDEYWPWPLSGTLKPGDNPESELVFVETGEYFNYATGDSKLEINMMVHGPPCVPKEGEVCTEIVPSMIFTLTREVTP